MQLWYCIVTQGPVSIVGKLYHFHVVSPIPTGFLITLFARLWHCLSKCEFSYSSIDIGNFLHGALISTERYELSMILLTVYYSYMANKAWQKPLYFPTQSSTIFFILFFLSLTAEA